METDAGTPQVGESVGLAMAVVTAQERFTVPVKPFEGVTVMVAVLPLVAPGLTVMEPPWLNAKLALTVVPPVTVTLTTVVAVIFPVLRSVPVTVTAYVPAVALDAVSTARETETGKAPVMFAVDGMLHVGRTLDPDGDAVTAQERSTTPRNPFEGVAVMDEVFPEVAPAAMVIAPLFLSAKLTSVTEMVVELLDPV
jgi:hypothetical protein